MKMEYQSGSNLLFFIIRGVRQVWVVRINKIILYMRIRQHRKSLLYKTKQLSDMNVSVILTHFALFQILFNH